MTIPLGSYPGPRWATSAGPVRLAPDGVWQAAASPRRWWALTPPFHPYRRQLRRSAGGGFLSVPLSVGFRRLALRQRPALWCPDFPRPAADAADRGHPACGRIVALILCELSTRFCPDRQHVLERSLVGELAGALGAEHTAPARVHHELATREAFERCSTQERGQLLVERARKGGEVRHL
jgi:hypothetical protein